MRSSRGFIEVTGGINGNKYLINKSAIIFITPVESGRSTIYMRDGGDVRRIITKETYDDISKELFWWGWDALTEENDE